MKVRELIKNKICYFCFETAPIQFGQTELTPDKKFGYARIINPVYYLGGAEGIYLCGVYDYFTSTMERNIEQVKGHDFIMNQKLCFAPILRGNNKWTYIGCEDMNTMNLPDDLPHMTGAAPGYNDDDIVMYFKNGVYAPSVGLGQKTCETEYKNVKHLEDTIILSPLNILMHLYIELLKIKNAGYSDEELLEKGMLIDGPEVWAEFSEEERKRSFWTIKSLYLSPVYRDIPKRFREKAINEITL